MSSSLDHCLGPDIVDGEIRFAGNGRRNVAGPRLRHPCLQCIQRHAEGRREKHHDALGAPSVASEGKVCRHE